MTKKSSTSTTETKPVATRIYRVEALSVTSPDTFLVEATSQAQALRIVTADRYTAAVASGKEIAALMKGGTELLTEAVA